MPETIDLLLKEFQLPAFLRHYQRHLMIAMTRLDNYQVLVIDDIGYVKKTGAETQVLFEFIAHRYESGSLIITSNQPFSHWDHIFPDTMMTVAAIDRIIHHATIIEIEGDSYRRKQSLKNQPIFSTKTGQGNCRRPDRIVDAGHTLPEAIVR
jgi:predicted ATPase